MYGGTRRQAKAQLGILTDPLTPQGDVHNGRDVLTLHLSPVFLPANPSVSVSRCYYFHTKVRPMAMIQIVRSYRVFDKLTDGSLVFIGNADSLADAQNNMLVSDDADYPLHYESESPVWVSPDRRVHVYAYYYPPCREDCRTRPDRLTELIHKGLTRPEICNQLGVSKQAVAIALTRYSLVASKIPRKVYLCAHCNRPKNNRLAKYCSPQCRRDATVRRRKGKLSDDDIRRIRALRSEGLTLMNIADRFGVSFGMIHHIISGRSFSHVV